MRTAVYTRDNGTCCPVCNDIGALSYVEIPESRRAYMDSNGLEHVDHFGPSRDYSCRNCDGEFTVTNFGFSA